MLKPNSKKQPYFSLQQLILFATIASLYVALVPQIGRLNWHSLHNPGLYLGVALSFAVALGILVYIDWLSRLLDQKFDWHERPYRRLALQFFFGVVIPAVVDVMVFWVLYSVFKRDFNKGGFVNRELLVVEVSLLFWNAGYMILYRYHQRKIQTKKHLKRLIMSRGSIVKVPRLTVYNRSSELSVSLHDVVAIYRQQYKGRVYLKDGTNYKIKITRDLIIVLVANHHFFEIYRGVWFSLSVVAGIEKLGSRSYGLSLKEGIPKPLWTEISRDNLPGLKEALKAYHERK